MVKKSLMKLLTQIREQLLCPFLGHVKITELFQDINAANAEEISDEASDTSLGVLMN